MLSPLAAGTLLHGRYRLKGPLGQGEFGWIYMAVDQNRADQPCTLEEFRPAAHPPAPLRQLRDQFQAAIQDLTALNHPQVLRSRLMIADAQRLFLVQDDIVASTCREVLQEQAAQGAFGEAEVKLFLAAILPVLADLHDHGICHGNLNLDSILLHEPDQLPVLCHFGRLKQMAIAGQFQSFNPAASLTWLNLRSQPLPAHDLQDLALVILTLLTGQELPLGTNASQVAWPESLSPAFARLLKQMLAAQPGRYTSTLLLQTVRSPTERWWTGIKSLEGEAGSTGAATGASRQVGQTGMQPDPGRSARRSGALDPGNQPEATTAAPVIDATIKQKPPRDYALLLLATIFIALVGLVGWRISILWPQPTAEVSPTVTIASAGPASEEQMQTNLRDRRRQLDIDYSLFTELVDELFYIKHPDWRNRSLTGAEGAAMKAEWNQIAATLLDRLATLSQASRRGLGKYNRAAYDDWLATARPRVDAKIIETAADTQFFQWFPEQRDKTSNPRRLGQVWYAIARDAVSSQQRQ
jgi:serine/threonine protein kinase, bacterial